MVGLKKPQGVSHVSREGRDFRDVKCKSQRGHLRLLMCSVILNKIELTSYTVLAKLNPVMNYYHLRMRE